jgi:hypothetical protein
MALSKNINRYALIEALETARPNAEPPPSKILLKYPRLYHKGAIGSAGIAAVRIAEAMALDPAITTYLDGYLVAGKIRHRIGIEDFARWLWALYKEKKHADTAVDKFQAIIAANSAPASTYVLLNNVPLKAPIKVSSDLTIVPKSSICESQTYKAIVGHLHTICPTSEPAAALVLTHVVSPLLIPAIEAFKVVEPSDGGVDLLAEDLKNCLGLIGPCAPVAVATWTEFSNTEAPSPDDVRWHAGADQYLPSVAPLGAFDEKKATELLKQFLGLTPEVRTQIRVPLQRVNAALRQTSIVDQAIDLGVGLEALLLHDMDQSDGLRYRFALRGAVFLAPPGSDRKAHFVKLKALYDLRSKAVHKGDIPAKNSHPALLQEGACMCATLVTAIINHGRLPNWEDIILFNSPDA